MTQQKHIDAKWYAGSEGNQSSGHGDCIGYIPVKYDAGTIAICYQTTNDYRKGNLDEAKANAHLIAAAPELLEALVKMQGILSRCYGQQVAVPYGLLEEIYTAAIAKAKGAA